MTLGRKGLNDNLKEVSADIEPLDMRLRLASKLGIDPTLPKEDARQAAAHLNRSAASDSEGKWIMLCVDVNRIGSVCRKIGKLNIEVWRPQATRKVRVKYTRNKFREVPFEMVPGYVFVRVGHVDSAYIGLVALKGVIDVISHDDHPIRMSTQTIERWKKEISDASRKKVIQKNNEEYWLRRKVRVTSGPFLDFQGVVTKFVKSRMSVFFDLDLYGKKISTEFPLEIVENYD